MLCLSFLPPLASATGPMASRQATKKHEQVLSPQEEPAMERTGIPSPGQAKATLSSPTQARRLSGSATSEWSYDAHKLHLPLSGSPTHQAVPADGALTALSARRASWAAHAVVASLSKRAGRGSLSIVGGALGD